MALRGLNLVLNNRVEASLLRLTDLAEEWLQWNKEINKALAEIESWLRIGHNGTKRLGRHLLRSKKVIKTCPIKCKVLIRFK
jgi:hypothetical protein